MSKDKKITREQVKHLAWLARIKIADSEESKYSEEMGEILKYFRKLDEVDTEGVEPTHHVVDIVNVMREDKPETKPTEKILKIVPAKKDRFIKAPRIV